MAITILAPASVSHAILSPLLSGPLSFLAGMYRGYKERESINAPRALEGGLKWSAFMTAVTAIYGLSDSYNKSSATNNILQYAMQTIDLKEGAPMVSVIFMAHTCCHVTGYCSQKLYQQRIAPTMNEHPKKSLFAVMIATGVLAACCYRKIS